MALKAGYYGIKKFIADKLNRMNPGDSFATDAEIAAAADKVRADIAPVLEEAKAPAGGITAGDQFYFNDILYTASANIAAGVDIVTTGEGKNADVSSSVTEQIADIIKSVDITADYFDSLPNTVAQSSISRIYKKGNMIILQMVLLKSDKFEAETNYSDFAIIKTKYAPKTNINTCCFLTSGEYSATPYDIGYLYISSAGKLSTRNQSISAMEALKVNLTYLI